MTRKGRRLTLIASAVGVLCVAAGLVLFAMRDNIVFFYGPSELADKAPALKVQEVRDKLAEARAQQQAVQGAMTMLSPAE